MPRGRKPKPSKLKAFTGNPGKRPLPEDEPQPPSGRPDCPPWLDEAARAKWEEVIPLLEGMGVLTLADGDAVAGYCVAWSELRAATALLQAEGRTCTRGTGGRAPHPAIALQRTALRALLAYSAVLGLDPSSRTRLSVQPAGKEEDDFTQFLGEAR